ncbi:RNA-guided endonuclease TnpB family protein [Yaniella soli]
MKKKRFAYRVYPTVDQQQVLARSFGCARAVYNDYVARRNALFEAGENLAEDSDVTARKVLVDAKQPGGDRTYLAEVSAVMLQQSVRDAQQGFANFFASVSGKRKGPKMRPPRLKSKRQTTHKIRFTRNANFRLEHVPGQKWGWLKLPKMPPIKTRMTRVLPSEPSSVTITQWADGTYEASFVVEVAPKPALAPTYQAAGVDLGITDLAIITTDTGDARKVANPRMLKRAQRKLGRLQRSLSRRAKGSANRNKARVKVAKQHRKVAHARKDYHHKVARQLVDETQALAVEDLHVAGLITNRRLAKAISDVGWGMLQRLIREKANEAGRQVHVIDRFYPSTQLCSTCGHKDGKKPLHIRSWACSACGTVHDRDINAAKNIMIAAGLSEIANDCGGCIRPHPGDGSPYEAVTPSQHAPQTA